MRTVLCAGRSNIFFPASFRLVLFFLGTYAFICGERTFGAQPVAGDVRPSIVEVDVEPAVETHAAPAIFFVGQERREGGTQFLWCDIHWALSFSEALGKKEAVRLYFDYRDAKNFHFLDCVKERAFLGICEAGVERVLAETELSEATVRLARHGSWMALFQDGRLLLRAFDERLQGGAVGVRERGAERGLHVEPTEEIHFADDFMRAAKEEQESSVWRKFGCNDDGAGYFAIKEVRNPLLSANAFNFMAAGGGVKAVAGRETWDQYRFAVSMRGPEGGRIGLLFAFRDEKNYGLFRWSARKAESAGAHGEGLMELCLFRDGQEEILASKPDGYSPNQWYRAEVQLSYDGVRVFLDGHSRFDYWNPALCAGAVGLWAEVTPPKKSAVDPSLSSPDLNSLYALMLEHAVFDDVYVESQSGFEDCFRRPGKLSGGWLAGPGVWTVETTKAGEPGRLRPPVVGGKALIGGRRLRTFRLSCALRLDADPQRPTGEAGQVFLYRDESNYCAALVAPHSLKLIRVAEGKLEIMDQAVVPASAKNNEEWGRLVTVVDRGHVRSEWAGQTVEYFDPDAAPRGRVGLIALPASHIEGKAEAESRNVVSVVRFAAFQMDRPEGVEPLISSNAVFNAESSMNRWAGEDGEWMAVKNLVEVDGKPVDARWHCGQFPGDVEVSLEPREVLQKDFEVGLSAGKDGRAKNNGYIFRYRSTVPAPVGDGRNAAAAESSPQVVLIRQGEEKVNQPVPFPVGELNGLALRRCGSYVVGLVNGRPVITFRDNEPLPGTKLAYYVRGLRVKAEAIQILSPGFMDESFSRAPVEWRTAGDAAVAEISNRWQCDPRWTFFSLSNDLNHKGPSKAAVMWSKQRRPGDVSIEFFVGHKMEQKRGQLYAYARDINVTICSDGEDLTKGYTFMFGGKKNTESLILRNERVLDRRPIRVSTNMGQVHRHWFYVRIEKRSTEDGKVRLAYRVDDLFSQEPNGEWVVTDAQPLAGDRVALWVYDHAVMISRVRISGAAGEREDPAWRAGPLKTHYDLPEWAAHR